MKEKLGSADLNKLTKEIRKEFPPTEKVIPAKKGRGSYKRKKK